MVYVPVGRLTAGMKLAADIQAYHSKIHRALLLPKGSIITPKFLQKLNSLNVGGAYIDDGRNYIVDIKKTIDEDRCLEIVSTLKETFVNCQSENQILSKASINNIKEISQGLVVTILNEKNLTVEIVDLQAYDDCTYHHSLSVAVMSIAIGAKLGLSKERLALLGTSALLHDIGKLNVPVELITKPARLTNDEFTTVKEHPQLGANHLLQEEFQDEEIYHGVLMHHEKFDGTGYPYHLKGDEIPLFARIISVADVYDALTATRPYRSPMQPQEAMEYIMGNSGTAFDFDIIELFLRAIEPYPVGCCVKLSDGRFAAVTAANSTIPLRPTVQTIGQPAQTLELADDASLSSIVIVGIDYSFTLDKEA